MSRPLKDWKFTKFCASDPDDKYGLWISNGFLFFEDYDGNKTPLVKELGFFDRRKLWNAIKAEQKIRGQQKLQEILAPQENKRGE